MNTTQNQNTGQDSRAGSTHSQAGNGDSARQGAEELKQGGEQLRAKASEVAKDATREGKAQVDEYRNVAAKKVDTIAESVKAAAAKLEEGDVGNWSTQISGMADSMTRFSQGLREKSADEVMRDVNRLARENPAIFIGSAVAIGFGLTRVMRATAQPRMEKENRGSSAGSGYGYGSGRDDAYTSSTITGSSDPRLSNAARAGTGGSYTSASIGGGTGAGSAGGQSTSGAGTGVGTGSSGAGLSGASSQAGQSGFSGSNSPGTGSTGTQGSTLGDNDRSKSS